MGDDDCCSKCMPYKDGVFITAQVLAIAGVCCSWSVWYTGLVACVGFILLQVAWCCKLNKGGLITAGVFNVLAALGNLAFGILFILAYYPGLGAYALLGGVFMLASGILTFVFTCGKRFKKFSRGADDDDDGVPVVATKVQAVEQPKAGAGASTTKTITELPDGSKRIQTKTVNPDGSITVEESVERPMQQVDAGNVYANV
mmetsp:Transcript_45524/g.63277  ORF Transcript_45524/g.63277 Transcript_45524/m.63277 type:complete len:201 (-) Transcript_45524:161-763(-)